MLRTTTRLSVIASTMLLTLSGHAQTVLLFGNDFSAPNQTPVGNCGPDVDITLVNTLWGGTGTGTGGGGLWAQTNTVETVLINGPGEVYTDPDSIGGDYCLGMLSIAEDDRAALTLDSEGLPFVNLYMDISAIDLVACATPFGVALPTYRVMVFDSPGGVFNIWSPGTLLDEDTLYGVVPGSDPYTFTWAAVQSALDVSASADGTITVVLDLLTSGYAAFDNIVIEASVSQAGVQEMNGSTVTFWPDPTEGVLWFTGMHRSARWSIHDPRGATLLHGTTMDADGLDVSTLPPGPYVLQAVVNGRQLAARFIKR